MILLFNVKLTLPLRRGALFAPRARLLSPFPYQIPSASRNLPSHRKLKFNGIPRLFRRGLAVPPRFHYSCVLLYVSGIHTA